MNETRRKLLPIKMFENTKQNNRSENNEGRRRACSANCFWISLPAPFFFIPSFHNAGAVPFNSAEQCVRRCYPNVPFLLLSFPKNIPTAVGPVSRNGVGKGNGLANKWPPSERCFHSFHLTLFWFILSVPASEGLFLLPVVHFIQRGRTRHTA